MTAGSRPAVGASRPPRRRARAGRRRRPAGASTVPRRPARRLVAEHAERGVDRLLGHQPVGRVLAAADPDEAVGLDDDPMLARGRDRRAARRRDQRPQPGVRPDDVGPGQVDVEHVVDRREELVDLVGAGRRSVDRAARTARRSCRSASSAATARGTRPCPGPGSSGRPRSGSASRARPGGRRGSAAAGSSRPTAATPDRPPDAGRVDHDPRPDLGLVAGQRVADPRADDPAAVLEQRFGAARGSRPSRPSSRAVRATASV